MTDMRLFLDRSVGTKKIAAALRELGLDVETIKDRYGEDASTVKDTRWIEDATMDGRILIGADQRIRYNPLERQTICRSAARCFTFPRGDLTAGEMIERLVKFLPDIEQMSARPGPFVCHLARDNVVTMRLDCGDVR